MARDVTYILNLRDRFSGKLKKVGKNAKNLDNQLSSLRNTATTLFAGFIAQRVIGDIIKVGSEFEQLQISFETMLGSAEKARVLIKEITEFAIKTPFELKDVARGAKNLLAFGIAEEKILPTLKSLGDVAAGLSVPIERLILNFGQVRSQSRLTGRELRDFAIAGVPLLDTLSKTMGLTTAEITRMVAAGDVGFEEVEKAFMAMSGEGGKFFDLMKKQTASTSGQISNLRDVIGLLQRDLFKRLQPAVNAVVKAIQDMTAFLRDNIDTIIFMTKVIGVAIAAFVAYKIVVGIAAAATAIFNATLLLNPLAAFAGLLAAAAAAWLIFSKRGGKGVKTLTRLQKATNSLNKELTTERTKLNALFRIAKSENISKKIRKQVIDQINTQYGEYLPNLLTEKSSINDIEEAQRNANVELLRSIKLKRKTAELTAIETRLIDFEQAALKGLVEKGKEVNKLQAEGFREFIKGGALDPEEFAKTFKVSEDRVLASMLLIGGAVKEARKSRALIDALFGNVGIDGATAAGANAARVAAAQAGVTKITSAAPKIFNINIDKLVENFTVQSTTINESSAEIERKITETLIAGILDTQTLAR